MDENQSFMTLYDIPTVPQFEGLYYNASIESFEYQICSCLILKYKKGSQWGIEYIYLMSARLKPSNISWFLPKTNECTYDNNTVDMTIFRSHLLLGLESPRAHDPVLPRRPPSEWVPRSPGPQQKQHLPLPQDTVQWGPARLSWSVHSPGRWWGPHDLLVSFLNQVSN